MRASDRLLHSSECTRRGGAAFALPHTAPFTALRTASAANCACVCTALFTVVPAAQHAIHGATHRLRPTPARFSVHAAWVVLRVRCRATRHSRRFTLLMRGELCVCVYRAVDCGGCLAVQRTTSSWSAMLATSAHGRCRTSSPALSSQTTSVVLWSSLRLYTRYFHSQLRLAVHTPILSSPTPMSIVHSHVPYRPVPSAIKTISLCIRAGGTRTASVHHGACAPLSNGSCVQLTHGRSAQQGGSDIAVNIPRQRPPCSTMTEPLAASLALPGCFTVLQVPSRG